MITEFKGSIFDCPEADIIVHQANCFHTMGAGIAKVIAQKYPEAVKADKETIKGDKNKLGSFSIGFGKDRKIIINMYSQYSFSNTHIETDYTAMETALEEIKLFAKSHHRNIAIPYKIGCGLAGGDWNTVYNILMKIFDKSDVKLIICKLEK